MQTQNIPAALKEIPYWNPWKLVPDPDRLKPRKIPFQSTGKGADSANPAQWQPFEDALAQFTASPGTYTGLGVLATPHLPGIDIDNCVADGVITAGAQEVIDHFDTYTEFSPSGHGIRIFLASTWAPQPLHPQGFKREGLELYFSKRFLTVTGHHVKGTPTTVNDRTEQVRELYERLASTYSLQVDEGSDIEPIALAKDFLEKLRRINPRIAERIESEATALTAGADTVEALYGDRQIRVDRSRNDMYLAQWLLGRNLPPGAVLSVLTHPEWFSGSKSREKSGLAYAQRTIARAASILADRRRDLPDARMHWTEQGNAERLIANHGNNLRYCEARGGWLVWNGFCWLEDRTEQVSQFLHQVGRQLHDAAASAPDDKVAESMRKWAYKSEQHSTQSGSLKIAKALEGVTVPLEVFDSDLWSFPAQNGVIDLRTGELHPHQRSQYFTSISPVNYDPCAKAPRWSEALETWLPDPEVRLFLQRAVGYTLTGATSEQVFFFLHGGGSNGKTTVVLVLQGLLGRLCRRIATEAVTLRNNGTPGTLREQAAARLVGARMAVVSEVDRNARWAEGWLKDMTGSGFVATKVLYKDPSETKPTAKLWIDANHEPRAMSGLVDGTQQSEVDSFWRRLREIPFRVPVPASKRVVDYHSVLLREEGPGILAWAVAGCLDWLQNGLPIPQAMADANKEYRASQDVLRPFVEEWLNLDDEKCRTTQKDVYEAYKVWAAQAGEVRVSRRILREWLIERGLKFGRDSILGEVWKGVRLRKSFDILELPLHEIAARS